MPTSSSTMRCLRCGKASTVGVCDNCGYASYKWNILDNLECTGCEKQWSYWTCSKCGTSNPIKKTTNPSMSGTLWFIFVAMLLTTGFGLISGDESEVYLICGGINLFLFTMMYFSKRFM